MGIIKVNKIVIKRNMKNNILYRRYFDKYLLCVGGYF